MFYKCPQCNKVWQFPVKKCPECFVDVEKQLSNNIKVISVSKVNVPTLQHPQVPFYVLVLEDENKNKWNFKSAKEYHEGDNFKISQIKSKDDVAVWSYKYDYLETFQYLDYILNTIEITPETKILILPSLYSAKHPYLRENTSPEFLDGCLEFLIAKGANTQNIVLGAQSFDDIPIQVKAKKSLLLDVVAKYNVMPLILSDQETQEKEGQKIIDTKVDLIINLPILNVGHANASYNLLYLLEKDNFLSQKQEYPEEDIIKKLLRNLPQVLTIADAVEISNQDLINKFTSNVYASYNSLYLDRIFGEAVMDENMPKILDNIKLTDINMAGRSMLEIKFKLRN